MTATRAELNSVAAWLRGDSDRLVSKPTGDSRCRMRERVRTVLSKRRVRPQRDLTWPGGMTL